MTSLHLMGAGGHGRVVADVILSREPSRHIVWHDDAWQTLSTTPPVCDVRSVDSLFSDSKSLQVFVAIGTASIRLGLIGRLVERGHEVLTLTHSSAISGSHVTLGRGSVLMAGAIVQTGATLGAGVIVNTAATVDHDCQLADGVHVAPGAHLAGAVHVGRESWIGVGAVVREGIRIGSGVMIGAGAVVVRDVPDAAVVVGNPARRLERSR
ncbi:MAG: acetyltransferase [Pseudomonadales bacterium]|nr:acetyltransferase [Pseudomonadales bacterium]